MTQSIIQIILGINGRRIPEYGGACNAWSYGLLADYYRHSHTVVSAKHIRKCLAGQCRLSHVIADHYRRDDGYDRILSDVRGIAATCTSLSRLRKIQAEVHDTLPENLRTDIGQYYHPDATREQVAEYLAQALWRTYHL